MNKSSKILSKIIYAVLATISLCVIILILFSWSSKPKDEIVDNPISSRVETIVLGSEKELPFESSFGEEEKAKAFITFQEDVLKVWLFNPEISKYFFRWEKQIRPSGDSWYMNSWFSGSLAFYIKKVSLKDNLLEIESGIFKSANIATIILLVFMMALAIFFFKHLF